MSLVEEEAARGVEGAGPDNLPASLESLALAAVPSGRHEHAHLLLQASARERDRIGLRMPAFGGDAVMRAIQSTAEILSSATSLVQERVNLIKFEELVAELLPARRETSRSRVS